MRQSESAREMVSPRGKKKKKIEARRGVDGIMADVLISKKQNPKKMGQRKARLGSGGKPERRTRKKRVTKSRWEFRMSFLANAYLKENGQEKGAEKTWGDEYNPGKTSSRKKEREDAVWVTGLGRPCALKVFRRLRRPQTKSQ